MIGDFDLHAKGCARVFQICLHLRHDLASWQKAHSISDQQWFDPLPAVPQCLPFHCRRQLTVAGARKWMLVDDRGDAWVVEVCKITISLLVPLW